MKQQQVTIEIRCPRPGLHEISRRVEQVVRESGIRTGMCHVFVQHTSASLLIQENADPSARLDLERFFGRIAPEGERLYTHAAEGPMTCPRT